MGKRTRRRFTAEFKAETVRVVRESGKSVGDGRARARPDRDGAAALGGAGGRSMPDAGAIGALTTDEREELAQLRREVRTLRMERDILKKATAFFAKESE